MKAFKNIKVGDVFKMDKKSRIKYTKTKDKEAKANRLSFGIILDEDQVVVPCQND